METLKRHFLFRPKESFWLNFRKMAEVGNNRICAYAMLVLWGQIQLTTTTQHHQQWFAQASSQSDGGRALQTLLVVFENWQAVLISCSDLGMVTPEIINQFFLFFFYWKSTQIRLSKMRFYANIYGVNSECYRRLRRYVAWQAYSSRV